MRTIPSLQVLCLRSVGSQKCSAEESFAERKSDDSSAGEETEIITQQPSSASLLLRSFHKRNDLKRTVCIGPGATRRANANDLDLNHPVIGQRMILAEDNQESEEDIKKKNLVVVMEYGSPALDCLQSIIDSLVELGRMDDSRLGLHFFQEFKTNIVLAGDGGIVEKGKRGRAGKNATTAAAAGKRRKSNTSLSISLKNTKAATAAVPLGSISFQNCAIGSKTMTALSESGLLVHLAVIDLTGVYSLNDTMLTTQIFPQCHNLRRLSVKNCRRLTDKSLQALSKYCRQLRSLDIGGSYNITPQNCLDHLLSMRHLEELHASGLGWKDFHLESLLLEQQQQQHTYKALSFGFSTALTATVLRSCLSQVSDTLISLALPFCENLVDNALMGILGRNLPNLQYLDVRGNSNLFSMTGWYDGRASADLGPQPLFVLARFSSLTKTSLEDTLRIHPLHAHDLTCILDRSGNGQGIFRTKQSKGPS